MGKTGWALIFVVGSGVFSTPVLAKDPVNQCTGPGQMLSFSAFAPQAGESIQAATFSGDRPDGVAYPEGPKFQSLMPKMPSSADLGQVNLKTGGYSFTSQDISIGQGEFPARLHIDRTYDSATADAAPDGISGPHFGPGGPNIRYFGVGSTHNLDMQYSSGFESFGTTGPAYKMIYVSLGFKSLAFQKCANGEFVSSRRDATRLTPIGSVPNAPPAPGGGYRLDLGDGTRIYFFEAGEGVCHSVDDDSSQQECGFATRWEAPNGDWATFSYQKYFEKPDRAVNQHLNSDHRIDSYDNTEQLCIATASSSNDCRTTNSTYYFYHESLSDGWEQRLNNAIDSYRITSIQNSRNLKLQFTYLDVTVDAGGICTHYSGQFPVCSTPKNTLQERRQIGQIQSYVGTSLSKQSSYQYSGNTLTSFTAVDGGITKYNLPSPYNYASNQTLKIFLPTDHTTAAVTVDVVLSKSTYFQHLPIWGTYLFQSQFTPHDYRKYPRAINQTFADGRVVNYNATLKNKWRSDSVKWYASPSIQNFWTPVEYITKMDVVEPGNAITSYRFDDEDAPLQVTDPLARNTVNTYDDVGNLLTSTLPEGNSIALTYDARGNVVQRVTQPKAGSGLSALTETTSYLGASTVRANGCPNQMTCNRPASTTDARGATSNFTWDTTTGMLTSATMPADSSGNHPITSFGYTAYTAPSGGAIRLLTSEIVTTAPGQQTTTAYGYDAANRYYPKEIIETSAGTSLRTCVKLGPDGTPISETKPNANLTSCP